MHLKVVLQGELGTFTSRLYATGKEFRELEDLLCKGEVLIADELARIGEECFPTLDVILCNIWCRAQDINDERITYIRSDKLLEISTIIEAADFMPQSNDSRYNDLFYRALSRSATAFRKYQLEGGAIEKVRDKYFAVPKNGNF